MIVALKDLCRLCCCVAEGPQGKHAISSRNSPITLQIFECFGIKVEENDALPNSVCEPCHKALSTFHKFRSCTTRNDISLNKLAQTKDLVGVEVKRIGSTVALRAVTQSTPTPLLNPAAPLKVDDSEDENLDLFLNLDDQDGSLAAPSAFEDSTEAAIAEDFENLLQDSSRIVECLPTSHGYLEPALENSVPASLTCQFCDTNFEEKNRLKDHIIGHLYSNPIK
jgi:hypothetical protein